MATAVDAVSDLVVQVDRARTLLSKAANRQIRSAEHRTSLKALALAWFHSVRPLVIGSRPNPDIIEEIDSAFRTVLDATDKNAAKTTYDTQLQNGKRWLLEIRGILVTAAPSRRADDAAPDFTPLANDPQMRKILERRWDECLKCVSASAHLAAIVMMGALLEALFVARANRMTNKAALFSAKLTPVDPKTKKPLELRLWTLAPYVDVAHELAWITKSAKDVAVVLRDYRNYVHPEKERAHGVMLSEQDSAMLWEVTKVLARQLLSL